jgi:ABC-type glycerol-3-phosphate transport system substrate-binding protein
MRSRTLHFILLIIILATSGCERISIPSMPAAVPTHTLETESTSAPTSTPKSTPTPRDVIGIDASALAGLEIEIWHAWGSPQKELLEAQIADFNRRNLWNITVNSRPFADWISLYEAVNQAAESDELPELVVALPEYALAWDDRGIVVDLMDYSDHPKWGLTPEEIADIPEVFWEQDQVGEKRLGIPAERSTRLLFYNARWGRELGFESSPENELEFQAQACAANMQFRSDSALSNDGYGGWIVDSDPQSALSWLHSFGGSAVDGNSYNFVTDGNTAAMAYLKKLFDDSCAWIYTGLDPYTPLVERTALFGTGDLSELADQEYAFTLAENSDDWEVIPFPGGERRTILVYGPSYTVMEDSPEQQLAAWLFARSMLNPQIQTQWTKATGMLPLRNSSMNLLKSYAASHPQWAQAVGLLDLAELQPKMESWRTVKYTLGDGLYSIFRLNTPASEVPSVLEQIQKTAEDLDKK